jgi:hypothetical protein
LDRIWDDLATLKKQGLLPDLSSLPSCQNEHIKTSDPQKALNFAAKGKSRD